MGFSKPSEAFAFISENLDKLKSSPPIAPAVSSLGVREVRTQVDLALSESREEFALTTLALFQRYLKCCGFVETKNGKRPINLDFGVHQAVSEALAKKMEELSE